MSIASRTAETVWNGSLTADSGTISGASGALDALPVTWVSRTEQPGGRTSPEELAAAAHSSCYSMALALHLGENGVTVEGVPRAALPIDPHDLTDSSEVTRLPAVGLAGTNLDIVDNGPYPVNARAQWIGGPCTTLPRRPAIPL